VVAVGGVGWWLWVGWDRMWGLVGVCVCGRVVGCVGVVCVGWDGGWCGVWGLVGVCVWACDGVCGRRVWVCLGGRSPLALEHSKVCTMSDFGHLQFKILPCLLFFSFVLIFCNGCPRTG
jgi:hypothetical protein